MKVIIIISVSWMLACSSVSTAFMLVRNLLKFNIALKKLFPEDRVEKSSVVVSVPTAGHNAHIWKEAVSIWLTVPGRFSLQLALLYLQIISAFIDVQSNTAKGKVLILFSWYWQLNSWPHGCETGTVLLTAFLAHSECFTFTLHCSTWRENLWVM